MATALPRRIEQLSEYGFYQPMVRSMLRSSAFQARDWTSAESGVSDNHRKAKFEGTTRSVERQMKQDRSHWERLSNAVSRVLAAAGNDA